MGLHLYLTKSYSCFITSGHDSKEEPNVCVWSLENFMVLGVCFLNFRRVFGCGEILVNNQPMLQCDLELYLRDYSNAC